MKLRNNIAFDNIIDMYEEQAGYTFDSIQIDELKTGYENGINIEAYADPYHQLRHDVFDSSCNRRASTMVV